MLSLVSCELTLDRKLLKFSLCLITEALCHEDIWEIGDVPPPFFTLVLDGGKWLASYPGCFSPGERGPSTHWTGGQMGPRACVDAVENIKSCLCQEVNPGHSTRSLQLY
jgi:hypothetical protein